MFEVVTDIDEIARLNSRLGARLHEAFPYNEQRELTYPSGHLSTLVHFESDTGKKVHGWASKSRSTKFENFLVIGRPGTDEWLEISVQLSFPVGKYHRHVAGAFVKDETGKYFIAHRGRLTKGMGALKVDLVLDQFTSVMTAKDVKKDRNLILIAELNDPELTEKLFRFALETREVATGLAAQKEQKGRNKVPTGEAKDDRTSPNYRSQNSAAILGDYFDEFAGECSFNPPAYTGKRVVTHGAIVSALAAHLKGNGSMRKSQAIDLAVDCSAHVDLYEVKTSAGTTDVYTAVGQLFIHGEAIVERLGKPVCRYLVLPDRPSRVHEKHIVGKGGIKIITFKPNGSSYRFEALEGD